MSIRDAIEQLLTGETRPEGQGFGPAAVLAEHGYDDVPTELFGTALVHFSDTAPLAQADALAPVVTRVSPIPFENDDLPPLEGHEMGEEILDGSDPFALFESAPPVLKDLDDLGEMDLEPDEFDEPNNETNDAPKASDVPDQTDSGEASGFGSGTRNADVSDDDPSRDTNDEEYSDTDDASLLEELAPRFDPTQHLGEIDDDIEVEGTDLFSVEFDESDQADHDADPDDLDFDVD